MRPRLASLACLNGWIDSNIVYSGNNDKVDIVDSVPCNDVILSLSYVLYIIVMGYHEYAIVYM